MLADDVLWDLPRSLAYSTKHTTLECVTSALMLPACLPAMIHLASQETQMPIMSASIESNKPQTTLLAAPARYLRDSCTDYS